MEVLEAIWDVLNTPVTQIQERDLTLLSIIQLFVIMTLAWIISRLASRFARHVVVDRLGVAEPWETPPRARSGSLRSSPAFTWRSPRSDLILRYSWCLSVDFRLVLVSGCKTWPRT